MTNPKDELGIKKAPLRLVPSALEIHASDAMAIGAKKYGPYNWRENPVQLTIYYEAALRHLRAWFDGQDLDPESGENHLGHVAACVAIMLDAIDLGNGVDDRPPPGPAAQELAKRDRSKKGEPTFQDRTRVALAERLAAAGSTTPLAGADSAGLKKLMVTTEGRVHSYNENCGRVACRPARVADVAGDLPDEDDETVEAAMRRFNG